MNNLRALTLIRPMSAAIVHGTKRIENRPQDLPKAMRGVETVVAVHAGRQTAESYFNTVCAIDGEGFMCSPPYAGEKLDHQGIVGLMLLSGKVFTNNNPPYIDLEACISDVVHGTWPMDPWWSGPYGYEISAAVAFPGPIPCRGMLGFWRVPAAIEEQISMSGAYDDLYRAARRDV